MIQRLEKRVMSMDQDRAGGEKHSRDLRFHCPHTGAAFAFEFEYLESISATVSVLALAFSSELALQRRQQTPSMPREIDCQPMQRGQYRCSFTSSNVCS